MEENNKTGRLKAECTWEPSIYSVLFGSGSTLSLAKSSPNLVKSPSSFPVQVLLLSLVSVRVDAPPLPPPPPQVLG